MPTYPIVVKDSFVLHKGDVVDNNLSKKVERPCAFLAESNQSDDDFLTRNGNH